MKVQLERSFRMPAPPEVVWKMLQDVELVAGCMPGARITERIDERHFKGTVSVRVGPATMTFRGDIEVQGLDAATKSLHLLGKGTDSTGTSGASMDLTASVQVTDAGSQLVGKSEVSMSGKAAAFGSRVMNTVADQVLKQFADNFALKVQALASPAPASAAPGEVASKTAPAGAPLNGLALLWAILKEWLRALFGKSAA